MDALRTSLIKDYQAAREDLLKPAKANLNYYVLADWLNRWLGSIRRLTPLEGNWLEVQIRACKNEGQVLQTHIFPR